MALVIISSSLETTKYERFEEICKSIGMKKSEFVRRGIELLMGIGEENLNKWKLQYTADDFVDYIIHLDKVKGKCDET